jgi:hypothetical protein
VYITLDVSFKILETVVPDSSTAKIAILPTYSSASHQPRLTRIFPEYVVSSIKKLVDDRTYPDGLFK